MTKAHKSVLDGVIETVGVGTSLTVNNTDPKNPVVNAKISDQATAEAGTNDTDLMTPLRVAQSIAKNSPPTDTSTLSLLMADTLNLPIFGKNWAADTFETLTYVDVSGATNLSTATPGVLKAGGAGNDSFTRVLLHFDGANDSTTITDSGFSGQAKTWTANGNAKIITSASKFGGASLSLDGTGDFVSTPDSTDFTLANADFTIDAWFNVQGGGGTRRILFGQSVGASDPTTSFFVELDASNHVVAYLGNGTALTVVTGTTVIGVASGWHHVEFSRNGNILRLFVNGVQEGGNVAFTGNVVDVAGQLSIGALGNFASLMWNGLIDEFRLSVGIARHTANFTPPTTAYAAVGNFSVNYLAAPTIEVPVNMSATLQVKEISASTPGTDYKVDFRRSVSGPWIEATFGESFMTPSGVKHIKVNETNISSTTSGNIPSLRFRTLNSKDVEFHGLYTEFYGADGGWQSGGSP